MVKDLCGCKYLIELESKGCLIKSNTGVSIGMGLMGLAKPINFQKNVLDSINF